MIVRPSAAEGHTRAPQYAQGMTGSIVALLGCHSFPDSCAAGSPECKQLYTVVFQAQDLWGEGVEQGEVLIDLWEPYLERAED